MVYFFHFFTISKLVFINKKSSLKTAVLINKNIRVIIAPLDWGLGHVTRCIPIIKHLVSNNCIVFIAADETSKKLLEIEFPQLRFLPLKGYEVRYTNSKRLLPIKILLQLPKLYNAILKEHDWLSKMVITHSIDAIISDNRYGMWSSKIPSIFITHQLLIKGPNKWIETLLQKVNYKHINRFTSCWVPDFEKEPSIAGLLSHPKHLPKIPVKYLGPLSRLSIINNTLVKYNLLIVLSGPEPQRSLLEKQLLRDLKTFTGTALLVRGLPGNTLKPENFNNTSIENHLSAHELEAAFNQAEMIISRAGYTTVMDIIKLKKRSILIPTPGQTEQEYLGEYLQQQQLCVSFTQKDFELEKALIIAAGFHYQHPHFKMDAYKSVIDDFLSTISMK